MYMNNFKRKAISLLNSSLDYKTLRKLYIAYSGISSWIRYGDSKFPRIISIEINSHCNRTCAYCPNVIYPQTPRLIKDEVISAIISRIGELKYAGVVDFIFFSEPLLNKKLAHYVRQVKLAAPSCIPRICTNGDLLTEERLLELVNAGMDRIYVMRHNPTPEGWRARINALKEKYPGIMVVMDIDKVEEEEGLHDFNGLLEVKKHRGRHIVDGIARCQVHTHVCQVTIDGDWDLCCVDYAKTHQFGSLLKNSFLEIWNDPKFKNARKALEAGKPAYKVCQTCTCLVERKPEHKREDFVPRPDNTVTGF